jgi:hypothetical protein
MRYSFFSPGPIGKPLRPIDCRTPRWERWERRIYERIVPRLWPILVDGLTPARRDGAYAGRDVEGRLQTAVEALADRVPPHEQEAFLEAMYEPIDDPVGPIGPRCRCGYCGPARRRLDQFAAVPRERRVREAFVRMVRHHAAELFETPNAYDRRLGLPRVDRRHRRTVPKEADDGSLD